MAINTSNKGAINSNKAVENQKATDTKTPVVSNPDANKKASEKETQPLVTYAFNQTLSDGVRALHKLMDTDANPMTLSEVMHKVIANAFVQAYDSKVAAKHKTGYKYHASEYRAKGLSEEDFIETKLKPEVAEMRKKLLTQRVK